MEGPPVELPRRRFHGVHQREGVGDTRRPRRGRYRLWPPRCGLPVGGRRAAQLARPRAGRPGGLVLAALADVALAYLRRDGEAIAFWRMAATPVAVLQARAEALGVGAVIETGAVPGGGMGLCT